MSDTPLTLMRCQSCGMTAKCLLAYGIKGRHGPGLACSSHDWVAVTPDGATTNTIPASSKVVATVAQADDNGHTGP